MLAEPLLRISATKGSTRNKGCTSFQNSLRTLAILMTANHERRSPPPPAIVKNTLSTEEEERKTAESLTYPSLHHLQRAFTQAIQFEMPQTPGRGRAGSTVPILQGEKFRVGREMSP